MSTKLNLALGYWNGTYMMGAYYYRALKKIANVWSIGPEFSGEKSDFPCDVRSPITPIIDKIPEKIDYYVQFYSKPDFFPPDLFELDIPIAWYVYDTHVHLDELASSARAFDLVFCPEENDRRKLLEKGLENVEVLDFGAEKESYYREQTTITTRKHKLGFAGSVTDHPQLKGRKTILDKLASKYDLHIENRTLLGPEVSSFYQDCTIVVNHAIKNEVNMRNFEVMMSGRPLLTLDVPGLKDYIQDGVHATFYTEENLYEKVDWMLSHPEEIESMAAKAQELTLEKFSYTVHAQKLIETLTKYKDQLLNSSQRQNDVFIKKCAIFRYYYFRFPGDAFQWLIDYGLRSDNFITKLLKLQFKLLISILKFRQKFSKGIYFQAK